VTSGIDLNDPHLFPFNGPRTIEVTAEDPAGNVSPADTLSIFLDTQGPQVFDLYITNAPSFNLFDVKPTTGSPTPLVTSLTLGVVDDPARAVDFEEYVALLTQVAETPGIVTVKGDHVGLVSIRSATVTNLVVQVGRPATATIRIDFVSPLPDDRYTLTLGDGVVDPAGNRLDGESNARQPLDLPRFRSGDGQSGGDFVARFTVDSRPEIGTYCCGSTYLDINGNGVYDPDGRDSDQTNRDVVFRFGNKGDAPFAGRFAPAGATAVSGYDRLGSYAFANGAYRFLLDFTNDGVPDAYIIPTFQVNGLPVAGDFAPGHPGDEIGIFAGTAWNLDTNGDNNLGPGDTILTGNMRGFPIVGDFDGDGRDDLATFQDNRFYFDLASNGLTGNADVTLDWGFTGVLERPVAADMNADGVDDIGLFVPGLDGQPPRQTADWYFLVSSGPAVPGTISALQHPFTPAPFGNDLLYTYGDRLAVPLVGNFDPPLTVTVDESPLIRQAYQYFLGRQPDAAGLDAWNAKMNQGLSDVGFVANVLGSGEYFARHGSTNAGFIAGLFKDLLGRAPSVGEVTTWSGAILGGQSRTAVALDILGSPEALARQHSAAGWVSSLQDQQTVWVGRLYQDVLHRSASPAETTAWVRRLGNGMAQQQVVDAIANSTEAKMRRINAVYQQYLGRQADGGGMSRWLRAYDQGGIQAVLQGVLSSQEYFNRQGGSVLGFVQALYRDLLGRSAGQSEVNRWVPAAGQSGADVVRRILASDEFYGRQIKGAYQTYLGRNADGSGLRDSLAGMRRGMRVEELVATLLSSVEYRNRTGA
jgi:hypothetical protein